MPNDSPSTPVTEFTQADAAAGNAEAQFGLGFLLATDSAAPERLAQAFEWYQKAADQNHHLAQFNLGQMFAQGHGTPRNDSMAVMWMRRAADGGDAGAQFNLGDRYERASIRGLEMDAVECRVESYKWFTLAAVQDYREALSRCDSITMRMTREEVTEGNRRVKAFVAS